jgi:class 3 adenylate cyclase
VPESATDYALDKPDSGLLSRLLNIGATRGMSLETRVACRHACLASLICFFVAVMWAPLAFLVFGSLAMTLIHAAFAVLFLLAYLAMILGYQKFARIQVIVLGTAFWFVFCVLTGPMSGVEFFLAIIVSFAIICLTREERLARWLLFLLMAAASILLAYVFLNYPTGFEMSLKTYATGYYIVMLSLFAFISVVVYSMHFTSIENYVDLRDARNRTEELVKDLLPDIVAQRLEAGEEDSVIAESHGDAAILFADLVGFTALARKLSPNHLVELLNELFSACDDLAKRFGAEKIKTIGDCYMAATGVVSGQKEGDVHSLFELGLEIIDLVEGIAARYGFDLGVRVGISSGQVISGVIGHDKKTFDLWGSTVNLANQMESTGPIGSIQVSESAWWRLKERWKFERLDTVEATGHGKLTTFVYLGETVGETVDETVDKNSV